MNVQQILEMNKATSPQFHLEMQRAAFENWIETRKLVTKYNGSLAKGATGEYKDVRVQGHWVTWQAATKAAHQKRT